MRFSRTLAEVRDDFPLAEDAGRIRSAVQDGGRGLISRFSSHDTVNFRNFRADFCGGPTGRAAATIRRGEDQWSREREEAAEQGCIRKAEADALEIVEIGVGKIRIFRKNDGQGAGKIVFQELLNFSGN